MNHARAMIDRPPRFDLRVPVYYAGEKISGQGTVWSISTSGALIAFASMRPDPGVHIELRISFFPGSTDVPVRAHVVRHTVEGFAVRFVDLQAMQYELLQRALPEGA